MKITIRKFIGGFLLFCPFVWVFVAEYMKNGWTDKMTLAVSIIASLCCIIAGSFLMLSEPKK